MTVIVFLLDNSESMNQRTIQGTSLLDDAKFAIELFFKVCLYNFLVFVYRIELINLELTVILY